MNNDHSGGVIFGGVPIDNYQSNTTPPVNNNPSESNSNATGSPIISVTPIMSETPNNSDSTTVDLTNTVAPVNAASSVTPVWNVDSSNVDPTVMTTNDNALGVVESVSADAVSPVVPNAVPVSSSAEPVSTITNDVTSPVSNGILGFELSNDSTNLPSATSEVANNNDVEVPKSISSDIVASNITSPVDTASAPLDSSVSGVDTDAATNQNSGLNPLDDTSSNSVSVGKYLGYMFLFMIPVVGLIMLVVKALDKKDKNISNYAKAQLLFGFIMSIIVVVFTFIFLRASGNTISDFIDNFNNNSNGSYTVDYE